MSLRRSVLVGSLILATLGVVAGISLSAKSANAPLPLPQSISELNLEMPNGKLAIREADNAICYTLVAFGQEHHGEIKGADFRALRKAGKEDVINQVFLNHIREEIKAINAHLATNQSLPLDGSAAFAQMKCLDCGSDACFWQTRGGKLDRSYPPPYPCACLANSTECNYLWYTCPDPPYGILPPGQCP